MTVTCPECQARFRLDASKVGPEGARVRCVKCQHVFAVAPETSVSASEKPAPTPAAENQVTAQPSPGEQDLFALLSQPELTAKAASESPPPPAENSPLPTTNTETSQTEDFDPNELGKDTINGAALARIELQRSNPEKKLSDLPQLPEQKQTPKMPSTKRFRPIVEEPITWSQQMARIGTVIGIIFLGIFLGLLLLGVTPSPKNLSLLLHHGTLNAAEGAVLLGYDAHWVPISAQQRRLIVFGRIQNHSDRALEPPSLRIRVFSDTGRLLKEKTEHCCQKPIPPHRTVPFLAKLELDATPVARYHVELHEQEH